MRRTTYVLTVVCILVPVGATAAESNVGPTFNCKTAKFPDGVDPKVFGKYCAAEAAAKRAAARGLTIEGAAPLACSYPSPGGPCVVDNLKSLNALVFPTSMPVWTDEEIMAQFVATRDDRYMATPADPNPPAGFMRRISWMFPDDGCFARAEQVHVRADLAGFGGKSPWKLIAFSDGNQLHVHTDNKPAPGIVNWTWHIVPVVKNTAGEIVVLDAALSPCRPLYWKDWLRLMTDNIETEFGDPTNFHGVGLGDPDTYSPWSLPSGDGDHGPESLSDEVDTYLPKEWNRQENQLPGRDADVVLGDSPPWSGAACIRTSVSYSPAVDIAAGASTSAIATCPYATLSVGGGLMSSDTSLLISKNARVDNGWEIAATNTSTVSRSLVGSAVCLTGAPQTASVSTVTGPTVNIPRYWLNSTVATCSSGILVGGGYSTTVSGSPASIMKIFSDGRNTAGNGWRVSAYNTADSGRSVTSYAYCLNNTSFSASQTSGTLSTAGIATASCPDPLLTMGGGFTFPWTSTYYVATMDNQGSDYVVDMLPPPASPDANARAYAQCLSISGAPPTCTEATATDMGAEHSVLTVSGNACLKITQYPGSWVGSVILQAQGSGSGYPIPFTWTNCSNNGVGSITGDWSQSTLHPVSSTCTTVIDLNGSNTSSIGLTWWANG